MSDFSFLFCMITDKVKPWLFLLIMIGYKLKWLEKSTVPIKDPKNMWNVSSEINKQKIYSFTLLARACKCLKIFISWCNFNFLLMNCCLLLTKPAICYLSIGFTTRGEQQHTNNIRFVRASSWPARTTFSTGWENSIRLKTSLKTRQKFVLRTVKIRYNQTH